MRPKFSVYIAVSLDGFIARENGELDWLPGADGEDISQAPQEDYGYAEFTSQIDCMVMGRGTFEKVKTFSPWPYEGQRLIVMSESLETIPAGFEGKIELSAETPMELASRLGAEGIKHIYLDGGMLVQSFIRAGLLDDMIITRIPILIGTGKPLFGALERDITLSHEWTKSFPNGFVQSRYSMESL